MPPRSGCAKLTSSILYSFHKKQNALKENSVHATYLVSGRPAAYSPAPADEGDIPSSVPEQLYSIESKRVSIVAEASLRGMMVVQTARAGNVLT